MSASARQIGVCAGLLLAMAAGAAAQRQWTDEAGDAVVRRTDSGNDGPLGPGATLPDVVSLTLSGWQSPTPVADPFTGSVDSGDASLVRIDVVFAGLVNPPGPMLTGTYDPFRYGPSPVYGFVELDLRSHNGGGELGGAERHRYMANVGRFGGLPYGSAGENAARSRDDWDDSFWTPPQIEITGADFVVTLCGCFVPTVLSQSGDGDGVFEAGESWILEGPFFERCGGVRSECASFGGASGTPGLYDPRVKLRFAHDAATDRTTVSLVYAMDNNGSRLLRGESSTQTMNFNVADQNSIAEAIMDMVEAADRRPGGPVGELLDPWRGRDPLDYRNVHEWDGVQAIFGTAYLTQQDSLFVWTDVGFNERRGDWDYDGVAGPLDRAALQDYIAANDGGADDCDGIADGSVQICNFGPNFSCYDVNGDGFVNAADLSVFCPADLDGSGGLTLSDFVLFRNLYVAADMRADFDGSGTLTLADFVVFRNAYTAGCP